MKCNVRPSAELSVNISVDGDAKRGELGELDTAQLVETGAKEIKFFLINLAHVT